MIDKDTPIADTFEPRLTQSQAEHLDKVLVDIYMGGAISGITAILSDINDLGHGIESGTYNGELPESMSADDKSQGLDMLAMTIGVGQAHIDEIHKASQRYIAELGGGDGATEE